MVMRATIERRLRGLRSIQTAVLALGFMAVFAMVDVTVSAALSSGYVYVAVAASACAQASPCASPRVLVVDAATAEVATSIDLPVHTAPKGITISPDGTRLYVSNFGAEFGAANSLTVIDARHNVLLSTVSLSSAQYGRLAVGADPSRVFLLSSTNQTLYAIDASTGQEIRSVPVSGFPHQLAASAPLNRVFVGGSINGANSGAIYAYDADTLAELAHQSASTLIDFRASRDVLRLFDVRRNFPAIQRYFGSAIDASTFAVWAPTSRSGPWRHPSSGVRMSSSPWVIGLSASVAFSMEGFVSRFTLSGAPCRVGDPPTLPTLGDFTLLSPGNRLFAAASTALVVIDINPASLVKTIRFRGCSRAPLGRTSCTYAVNRTYVPLAGHPTAR